MEHILRQCCSAWEVPILQERKITAEPRHQLFLTWSLGSRCPECSDQCSGPPPNPGTSGELCKSVCSSHQFPWSGFGMISNFQRAPWWKQIARPGGASEVSVRGQRHQWNTYIEPHWGNAARREKLQSFKSAGSPRNPDINFFWHGRYTLDAVNAQINVVVEGGALRCQLRSLWFPPMLFSSMPPSKLRRDLARAKAHALLCHKRHRRSASNRTVSDRRREEWLQGEISAVWKGSRWSIVAPSQDMQRLQVLHFRLGPCTLSLAPCLPARAEQAEAAMSIQF